MIFVRMNAHMDRQIHHRLRVTPQPRVPMLYHLQKKFLVSFEIKLIESLTKRTITYGSKLLVLE